MSTFTGFSEEDLKRIKSGETGNENNVPPVSNIGAKKVGKISIKPSRPTYKYKSPVLQKQSSDDAIDETQFDKCKLSIRTPTSPVCDNILNNKNKNMEHNGDLHNNNVIDAEEYVNNEVKETVSDSEENKENKSVHEVNTTVKPDIVRGVENYTEDEIASHRAKMEDLQLKQKIMEEQNKKRKEMLAKALADRTKQTAEEVQRLEKIKKELQVLDGQFSQDVAVLRKKIDQACLTYSEAEKHYLKVEKEFLQAKINLQKEKEKKELLTEHLCALITHNETRKAQKLETLMLELATDKNKELNEMIGDRSKEINEMATDDENPVIIDGVDEKTGKMVEIANS
ncbi:hypothetical protein O3G_MSEX012905 [Manduca sexta]|uniref:RAB6-interacting golgin n=2 Tax=Manduca sexta TaxID=7130 RepID=A0A921ZPP3_MANSE|nr:hypothetical protein O3G_MSEX012905 [Manduca sexta]